MSKSIVYYAKDPNGGSMIGVVDGQPPPEGRPWREVSVEPHGDWYPVRRYIERRDAVRTFQHIETGETAQCISRGYDVRVSALAPAGHDICLYCGTDNGIRGELRYGFDCCQCGGN